MRHNKLAASALLLFSLATQGSLVYATTMARPQPVKQIPQTESPRSLVEVAEAAEEPPSTPQPTAAPTSTPTPVPVERVLEKPRPTGNASHQDWMTAAGIAPADFSYVEFIIQKESGWNPSARNGKEGACGLVQALPCSKLGGNWNDPVHALEWGNSYVSRYGGWSGAYNHWLIHHWY